MAYQTQDLMFGDFDTLDQHEQNNIRKILYGPRSSTEDRKVEFPWDDSRGSMFQLESAQGGDMVAPPETNCTVNMNTDPIPNYQQYHSDGPPQQQYQQHMNVTHEQMNSPEFEEDRHAYQGGQQNELYGNQFPTEGHSYRDSSVEFGYDPNQSEMSQGGGKQRRNKKKRPPGYYEKLEQAETQRQSQTDFVQPSVGNWADSAIGQVSPQNFFMPLNYPSVPPQLQHVKSTVSQHTQPPFHDQRPPGVGMAPPGVQERPFPHQGTPPTMGGVHPPQTIHQSSLPQQVPAMMATGNAPDARRGGSLPREGAHMGIVNTPQLLREASLPREGAHMGIIDQSQTYHEPSFPGHGPPPPMGNMALGSYHAPVPQNVNRNMSSIPPSHPNPAVNYTYGSSPQASHHMDQCSHNVPPQNSSTSYLPQQMSNPQTAQHRTHPPVDRELEKVSHQMSDLSVSQNTRAENPNYALHHHPHQGPQTGNTVYNSNNGMPVIENKPAGVRVNRPPGFNVPSSHLNPPVAAAISLNSMEFNIQDNYDKQPSPPRNTPAVQVDEQVVLPSEQYIENVQVTEPDQNVIEPVHQISEPYHQVSEPGNQVSDPVHQNTPEPITESTNSNYSKVGNELPDSSDGNTAQQVSGDLKLANVSNPSPLIQSEPAKPPKSSWSSLFKNVTPATTGTIPYSVTLVDNTPAPSEVKQNVAKDANVPNDPVSTEDDGLATIFGEALSNLTVSHVQVGLTPRGLVNRGNWCYINATLQALVACPPFCDLLRRMPKYSRAERGASSTPVLDCMVEFVNEFSPYARNIDRGPQKGRRMFQDITQGKEFEPVNVYKMLQVMQANQTFRLGRQEDAEEFLSCILDGLHEEMASVIQLVNGNHDSTPEGEANGYDQEDETESEVSEDSWEQVGPKKRSALTRKAMFSKSPIADIFVGYMRSAVFKSAAKESATLQPFFTLQLDIQTDKVYSVRDALEGLVIKESISGYTCTKTKQELEVAKKVTLEELPPVLVMHLKYFVFNKDGGCQKLLKKIDYPIDLEITRDLLSPNVKSKLQLHQRSYKLFAVVFHHGKMATGGGHYTTAVFHPAINGWISLDDNSVKPVGLPFVLKYNPPRVPYLLYYRRTDVH